MAHVKTLRNVALEAPDNIAQEKILFNVALIFLEQHCKGKRFRTILSMLPKKLQATLHRKNPVQVSLNTLGTTLHG